MIDKIKILGYILYGKYCGVKSFIVVKKKKLIVLCMYSKIVYWDFWLYEDWMYIVVKAMKYLRKYFCFCLNYVVFLFENIYVFLFKLGERNIDF